MPVCGRRSLIGPCLLAVASFVVACSPELERLPQRRSARGTLGEEVYKAVCRRIAGTELPLDVEGTRSEAVCLGDTGAVQQALRSDEAMPTRLMVFAQRRAEIVQAVDDWLPNDDGDELERLLRGLLPFYDPPEERVQWATRELAAVMRALANPSDARALSGLARLSQKGLVPREGALGLLRAPLAASAARDMASSVLPLTQDVPEVAAHFNTFLDGLGLELATIDPDEQPDSDIARLKRLLLRTHPDFGSGTPLFSSVRDARGLAIPQQLAPPFVDADHNGQADANGSMLATVPGSSAPTPFPIVGEPTTTRDQFGRALADGQPLYQTADADVTLLAGLLRELEKIVGNAQIAQDASLVSSAIIGPHVPSSRQYEKLSFQYLAPSQQVNPLLDLVHGSTALLDREVMPSSLALTQDLFNEHEPELAEALAPLLALERITRPDRDPYPDAKLAPKHTFWDELLFEGEKISRRRNSADGPTLLSALLRAALGYGRNLQKPDAPVERIVDPELLRHQGVVLASLMRFKDDWRSNPTGQSKRAPGEPVVLGSFRASVDRTQPDSPVTCGKDGCGGPIDGTLFERWKKPNQNCVIQRSGRPISGRDCGQPANQSIFQRSLGLIAEMAGRSQCNKAITIGDLLDYAVLDDPCIGQYPDGTPECETLRRNQRSERDTSIKSAEQSVHDDYTCSGSGACAAYQDKYPAAFVDPDGVGTGQPATIQACHLLNLPDVGRTFGAAVTHEFVLDIPNPWVKRYLEDVARAGDHDGDGTADLPACAAGFKIDDPTVPPPCIPASASLSRDLYDDMPPSVDTLGELVEFLLDDDTLFQGDADTLALRPDVRSLSRVLFAPAGSTSFIIFDPLLVRGSPVGCAAGSAVPECPADDTSDVKDCCIKDTTRPPLRYRLDTYYGATSFAWEHPIATTDGRTISFLDTMRTLSDAVARFDYHAGVDDPKNFEDTDYLFTTLGLILAQHYDSARNTAAQSTDPNGRNYRHLTGIVSYEALIADALDDGTIDLTQLADDGKPLYLPVKYPPEQQLGLLYHSLPLLKTLDALTLDGSSSDGIDVGVEVAEQLLNPHAHCAGQDGDRRVIDGIGACDKALAGATELDKPFPYRDGRSTICYRDGRCFDGVANKPKRFASVLYLLLDALDAIDDASDVDQAHDHALRGVISGVLDAYLKVADDRFSDRRFRALLVELIGYFRERLDEERTAGTLATLGRRTDDDAVDFITNPIISGALGLLPSLHGRGTAIADLTRYSASLLSEGVGDNQLRPLLASLFDLVQMLPGDAETNAALRATGVAFATNLLGALQGDGSQLHPELGAIGRNLYMLRATAQLDHAQPSTLEKVFKNLARVPAGRPSPLEVILDVALELERKTPGQGTSPSAEDLNLFLTGVADVLTDPQRGFERLYQIVHCTTQQTAPGCD